MKKITKFDRCPIRQEQIIVQKRSKDVLLFNIDDGSYYALNEVGNRIWDLCDGTHTVEQLVRMLAKEYNATEEMIETDALELLEDLRSKNLVVDRSGDLIGNDASDALQGSL